jgi:hypothetical protein
VPDGTRSNVNVEELFNAVQHLAGRTALKAAPFVSWHPMVEEFDRLNPPVPRTGGLYREIYESVRKEILDALSRGSPAFASDRIDRAFNDALKSARRRCGTELGNRRMMRVGFEVGSGQRRPSLNPTGAPRVSFPPAAAGGLGCGKVRGGRFCRSRRLRRRRG